jgi:hypothetical protein
MTDDETIVLRVTVIGDHRYADDYQVIWHGLPIGVPPHQPQWRFSCNVYGKPSLGGDGGPLHIGWPKGR